jgi:hypothetical protein
MGASLLHRSMIQPTRAIMKQINDTDSTTIINITEMRLLSVDAPKNDGKKDYYTC